MPSGRSAVFALACAAACHGSADNPIRAENARPGTSDWRLVDPALSHEIEGYASLTSVARGGSIALYVSTADPSYTIRIYRMGWYGGAGARLLLGPIHRTGVLQPMPTVEEGTSLVECDWTDPFLLQIPDLGTEWPSGVYLARLTGSSGKESYVVFVVRDDARRSTYLVQTSVATYQAYNGWGGASLYAGPRGPARKVSFNRPYAASANPRVAFGAGAGEFLVNLAAPEPFRSHNLGWEYNFVRFLERDGYDVSYSTDLDTHRRGEQLLDHRAFLVLGHDEYWSWEMRRSVLAARDHGVHLGIFSSDTSGWQIRLEPSRLDGAPDRTIVAYKEAAATEDPYALDGDPDHRSLVTTMWRRAPVDLPEGAWIGVMYAASPVNVDFVAANTWHWIYRGTGLEEGSVLPGLVGHEVDSRFADAPAGTVVLGQSPFGQGAAGAYAHMTIYQAGSGALVFASGTSKWSWGLDDFGATEFRPSVLSPAAQTMTRNLLSRFAEQAR